MSRDNGSMAGEPSDHVDEIVDQWRRERPAVDVSGMAVIGRISRLARAIQPRLEAVFARHGLEGWEFDVLATLLRSGPPHQLTPGELLASTMVTSGAMTHRIDRLEGRGLVERGRSAEDGRRVLVTLTPAGMAVVDAALVDHAANELELLAALDQRERADLIELLRRLGASLAADRGPQHP